MVFLPLPLYNLNKKTSESTIRNKSNMLSVHIFHVSTYCVVIFKLEQSRNTPRPKLPPVPAAVPGEAVSGEVLGTEDGVSVGLPLLPPQYHQPALKTQTVFMRKPEYIIHHTYCIHKLKSSYSPRLKQIWG